jgi:hypothetical protein
MFLLSLQVIEQIDVDDGDEESHTRTDGEISLDELMIWLVKEKIWVDPDAVENEEAGRLRAFSAVSRDDSVSRISDVDVDEV